MDAREKPALWWAGFAECIRFAGGARPYASGEYNYNTLQSDTDREISVTKAAK